MADLLTLQKFEALSPFEIKNELIDRARRFKDHAVVFLNAGRGNPNWVATTPRQGRRLNPTRDASSRAANRATRMVLDRARGGLTCWRKNNKT